MIRKLLLFAVRPTATPGEGTLIGTVDHGVLGLRYAYDGATDPVIVRTLDAASTAEPDLPGTVSAPWRGPDRMLNQSVVLRVLRATASAALSPSVSGQDRFGLRAAGRIRRPVGLGAIGDHLLTKQTRSGRPPSVGGSVRRSRFRHGKPERPITPFAPSTVRFPGLFARFNASC